MPWHELKKTWHDTTVDHCDVCGNLLIGLYWSFVDPDIQEIKRCCEESCERLFYRLREIDREAASHT